MAGFTVSPLPLPLLHYTISAAWSALFSRAWSSQSGMVWSPILLVVQLKRENDLTTRCKILLRRFQLAERPQDVHGEAEHAVDGALLPQGAGVPCVDLPVVRCCGVRQNDGVGPGLLLAGKIYLDLLSHLRYLFGCGCMLGVGVYWEWVASTFAAARVSFFPVFLLVFYGRRVCWRGEGRRGEGTYR